MKKFFDWLCGWLPVLWGLFWTAIITIGSLALLIVVVKWFMTLVGVL
jgi:hypothetical protein